MKAEQTFVSRPLHSLFERVRGGSFAATYPDGTTEHYGEGEPEFKVRFLDEVDVDLVRDDPFTGFANAYTNGRVEVEGDLADLVSLAIRNGLFSPAASTQVVTGATPGVRSLKGQKDNIAHHYDLGNDFFRLWLDESLTYTCAYFHTPDDTLEQAQLQKIEHSLRKLRLQPGETLLDAGCGWGEMVMRAAERFGVEVLGITLSQEQQVSASAAIASRGLQDKASVQLLDYVTLAREGKQFDKIVSIGMVEHVGKGNLPEFTRDLEAMLKPGGLALLHFITREGPIYQWVERNLFPGAYIPPLSEVVPHLAARGLRIWDVENLALHYRMTLDHWSERFERNVKIVREKFDERFVRMWRLYLRASSARFREGMLELHQILISRGHPRNFPLTREDLYKEQY